MYDWILNTDVKQEKQHMSLLQGVESFDLTVLKHADTTEKIVLPSAEGYFYYEDI